MMEALWHTCICSSYWAIDPVVSYIHFPRNFGQDNALFAGILHDTADAVITIDADLQHPPEMIPQLIQ